MKHDDLTNREIENRIHRAIADAVPDVLDSVRSDCEQQRGKVMIMTNKKTYNPWIKRIAGIAAAVVLVTVSAVGFQAYRAEHAVASIVALDVNPSVEIQVNSKDRVLKVDPLNQDGRIVIDDMDFKGDDLEKTVNALIGSMLRNGYLTDLANSILVSVDNNDPEKSAALQAQLSEKINNLLQTDTFSGAVLSQTIHSDSELQKLAETHGITVGKAQLIQQIISQDTRYTFENLAPLSINELNLLSASGSLHLDNVAAVGQASDKSYIGEARAKEIALKHAEVTEADVLAYKAEMDYEQGVLVYEMDFRTEAYEYDYDINATTGDVVKYEREPERTATQQPSTGIPESNTPSTPETSEPTPSEPNNSGSTSTEYIGEDAAKRAAFDHAGVAAADALRVRCELDHDDGLVLYEIEFDAGNYEYDYDINALTGTVVKYERDWDDDDDDNRGDIPVVAPTNTTAAKTTSQPTSSAPSSAATTAPTTASANYIGEDAAKQEAFAHAGVKAADATIVRCEFERDDGRVYYDIEFKSGGYEYDYDIEATTGAVIESERDRDDDAPVARPTTTKPSPAATTKPTTKPTTNYIEEEAAKQAAFAHAGVAASDVIIARCEFERDDGRPSYEIEFKAGQYDYDYDIDAITGTVIESDREWLDDDDDDDYYDDNWDDDDDDDDDWDD